MKTEAKAHMREMRVEIHRGSKKEVTGYTVHHHMEPSSSKSGAFIESEHHSYPFSKGEKEEMLDHVSSHLESDGAVASKGKAEAEAPGEGAAGHKAEEEEEGE